MKTLFLLYLWLSVPLWGQSYTISRQFLELVERDLQESRQALQTARNELTTLDSELTTALDELQKAKAELNELKHSWTSLTNDYTKLYNEYRNLKEGAMIKQLIFGIVGFTVGFGVTYAVIKLLGP